MYHAPKCKIYRQFTISEAYLSLFRQLTESLLRKKQRISKLFYNPLLGNIPSRLCPLFRCFNDASGRYGIADDKMRDIGLDEHIL